MAFVVLILAGGRSQRMGQDKSNLQRPDGLIQLDYLIALAESLKADRILVNHGHATATDHVSVIRDRFADKGPLSGIHAAVTELQDDDRLLVLPCDMPALNTSLLAPLLNTSGSSSFEHYPLPCLLQISESLRGFLERLLTAQQADLSVKHLLRHVNASRLQQQNEQRLINTNTPAQWQAFCAQTPVQSSIQTPARASKPPQAPTSSQDTPHG